MAIAIRHDAGKAKFDDPEALEAIGEPISWSDAPAPGGQQTLF